MNKISLTGLIFGLMILGSLFFVIGFLAAVATFGTGAPSTPTTWATANNQESSSKPSIVGRLAGAVGGKLVHDQAIRLESRFGGGALSKVVNKVPPSLQPFAVQAQNQLAIKSQQRISSAAIGGSSGIAGAFSPSTFGTAQQRPIRQNNPPSSPIGARQQPLRQYPPVFAPKNVQPSSAQQPQYRRIYPHPQRQAQPQQRQMQQNYQQQNYQQPMQPPEYARQQYPRPNQ